MGALLYPLKFESIYVVRAELRECQLPHVHRILYNVGVVIESWRNAPTIYVGAADNGTRYVVGTGGPMRESSLPRGTPREKSPSCLMRYL